jgi:hypothetical protein
MTTDISSSLEILAVPIMRQIEIKNKNNEVLQLVIIQLLGTYLYPN